MQIHAKARGIQNLQIKAKLVEEKDKGDVVDCHIVTAVSFECEGCAPGEFDNVLRALREGQVINAAFASPQLGLDDANVTLSGGGQEVSMTGEELSEIASLA